MSSKRIEDDGPDVQGVSNWPLCDYIKCDADATRTEISSGLPYCAEHAPDGGCVKLRHSGFVSPAQPQPSISVHAHEVVPRHLGGPTDDHYARLAVQPIEATEAWSQTWPSGIAYHLGEAVAAIARCGTKGQAVRDLRKASWLCERAADVIEGKTRNPSDKRR